VWSNPAFGLRRIGEKGGPTVRSGQPQELGPSEQVGNNQNDEQKDHNDNNPPSPDHSPTNLGKFLGTQSTFKISLPEVDCLRLSLSTRHALLVIGLVSDATPRADPHDINPQQ
jgi:hypothetical protein